MNNFPNPYGQQTAAYNYQEIQQMFPQPQGSVYAISAPTEIGNVPIGSTGLSVAICFNDQLMYIKSFQNGNPVIMAYRIAPYTKEENAPTQTVSASSNIEERLTKLETLLTNMNNEGGKFNVLL